MDVAVVGAVRTTSGRGRRTGRWAGTHPTELLADVLRELVTRTGVKPGEIDDVIAGCVTQGGEQGGNVARSAVLAAGFPVHVPGTTIDRQCGSSQQAVQFAAQAIAAGTQDVVVACGVESMSRVPMFSQYGDQDPHGPGVRKRFEPGLVQQGLSAELLARQYGLDRAELDGYAAESHRRAAATWDGGGFDREVLDDGEGMIDETVRPATTAEALAELPVSFADSAAEERFGPIDWRITAGNSSPLTDGASAVLLMSPEAVLRHGLTSRAHLRAFSVVGDDPVLMLNAVVPATRRLLERTGVAVSDIDQFEVNEAFAPVPLLWAREIGADLDRVNRRGGAIALGHPLGASGTRLLTTLLHSLEDADETLGVQTMCEAGGMANALLLERR